MREKIKSKNKISRTSLIISGVLAAGFISFLYFGIPTFTPTTYNALGLASEFDKQNATTTTSSDTTQIPEEKKFVATHIQTPEAVKAIYMTSWVAGTPSFSSRVGV